MVYTSIVVIMIFSTYCMMLKKKKKKRIFPVLDIFLEILCVYSTYSVIIRE